MKQYLFGVFVLVAAFSAGYVLEAVASARERADAERAVDALTAHISTGVALLRAERREARKAQLVADYAAEAEVCARLEAALPPDLRVAIGGDALTPILVSEGVMHGLAGQFAELTRGERSEPDLQDLEVQLNARSAPSPK